MFIPKHFIGQGDAFTFIAANSFGQLIGAVDGALSCTHLPLLPSAELPHTEGGCLIGHVARANPQAKWPDGQPVMCVFTGPHGYVSPSWYEQSGVPTWNYEAAHVQGNLRWEDDAEVAQTILSQLTAFYEAAEASPWLPDYPVSMLRGIRAFRIEITGVEFKQKLSQNRSRADREAVIDAVRVRGNAALADAMSQCLPDA